MASSLLGRLGVHSIFSRPTDHGAPYAPQAGRRHVASPAHPPQSIAQAPVRIDAQEQASLLPVACSLHLRPQLRPLSCPLRQTHQHLPGLGSGPGPGPGCPAHSPGQRGRASRRQGAPGREGVRMRGRRTAQCMSLLPPPLTYSTRLVDADPLQVAELWEATLGCARDPEKVHKALKHSFSIVVVIDEARLSSQGAPGTIVGVGRAVSDGAFVATICDVAVLPEYQKKGIGRRIVKELVKDMRRKGPSGFAVFPPPLSRRFFWHLGFRPDRKYRLMAYQGRCLKTTEEEIGALGPSLGLGLGQLLRRLQREYTSRNVLRHGAPLTYEEQGESDSGLGMEESGILVEVQSEAHSPSEQVMKEARSGSGRNEFRSGLQQLPHVDLSGKEAALR